MVAEIVMMVGIMAVMSLDSEEEELLILHFMELKEVRHGIRQSICILELLLPVAEEVQIID